MARVTLQAMILALFLGGSAPAQTPSAATPARAPSPATGTPAPGEEYSGVPQEPLQQPRVPPQGEFDSRLLRSHRTQILEIAPDGSRFSIRAADGGRVDVNVPLPSDRERLQSCHPGDMVQVETVSDEGDVFLKAITLVTIQRSPFSTAAVLLLVALVWLLLFWLLYNRNVLGLVVGVDGRYSKSQTQLAAWFFTLLVSYTALLALRATGSGWRLWGGIEIPQNLLLLSGLSALSFGAAKGITGSRVEQGTLKKTTAAQPALVRDLFYDDTGRHPDLGDFQMLVITAVAVVTYFGSVVARLSNLDLTASVTMPDVDTTILGFFGVGQGAYLVKKGLESGKSPAPPQGTAGAGATPVELEGKRKIDLDDSGDGGA